MRNILIILAFFIVNQLQSQTLTNTNWYLTKIEENNQVDTVPISVNGSTPGNWHLFVSSTPNEENNANLTSSYCSGFLGPIALTATTFNFVLGQIAVTQNLPCDWMTNEEIQYFTKYYAFFENYRNDAFTYIIKNNELVITNNAGNKAYYSNAPLSNKTFEKLDKEITLYPNPATSELFIKLSENEQLNSVKIFNSEGKAVRKENSSLLDISDLSSGMYFLEIDINGVKYTRKFIKK